MIRDILATTDELGQASIAFPKLNDYLLRHIPEALRPRMVEGEDGLEHDISDGQHLVELGKKFKMRKLPDPTDYEGVSELAGKLESYLSDQSQKDRERVHQAHKSIEEKRNERKANYRASAKAGLAGHVAQMAAKRRAEKRNGGAIEGIESQSSMGFTDLPSTGGDDQQSAEVGDDNGTD